MKIIIFLISSLIFHPLIAQSAGDKLFNTDIEHVIKIKLYMPADWDSIKARYQFASESLVYTPVQISIDNNVFDNVGLSIKGNTYIDPDTTVLQYPFKVDLNEFVDGQKYDKIKKFNLNTKEFDNNIVMNNVYAAFNLPYLRTSRSKVYLNNTYIGNYLIVEQVDKTYVKRIFNNDNGNLYKGDNQADLSWLGTNQIDYEERYSLKTNETANNYSDLIHFIDVLNNTKDKIYLEDSIKKNFDLTNYLKILSLQVLMGKQDDYFDKNHNYYLYHNMASNKFSYIPYDNDQIIYPGNDLFMTRAQMFPLFNAIFNTESIKQQYVNCMCSILSKIKPVIPLIEAKYNSDYSVYKEYVDQSLSTINTEIANAGYNCTTSIDNSNYTNVEIFTVKKQLYIKNNDERNTYGVLNIYSLTGKNLLKIGINSNRQSSVNLYFLNQGVYIATLQINQKVITRKIVISVE